MNQEVTLRLTDIAGEVSVPDFFAHLYEKARIREIQEEINAR